MKLKFIIKKLLYSYKASSKTYVNYLKNIGVQCGHNINIFCPKDTHIDTNNPYLLEIGNNVNMTGPVTIYLFQVNMDYLYLYVYLLDKIY